MGAFQSYITEHILSIGLNPDHEKFREKHRQEIHDIIKRSYNTPELNGYGALGSDSDEESKAIHKDISNSIIKATIRQGKVTSVNLYRYQFGRKSIASGTNGTKQGLEDYKKTKIEDMKQERAWGELSGKAEAGANKIGMPKIPNSDIEKYIKKPVISKSVDGHHYTRIIGDTGHEKGAYGFIKK